MFKTEQVERLVLRKSLKILFFPRGALLWGQGSLRFLCFSLAMFSGCV